MFGSGSHYTVPASIPAGCSLTASDKLSVSHIVLQELRRLLPLWGSCPPSPASASTATSLPGFLLLVRSQHGNVPQNRLRTPTEPHPRTQTLTPHSRGTTLSHGQGPHKTGPQYHPTAGAFPGVLHQVAQGKGGSGNHYILYLLFYTKFSHLVKSF